jgi:hypothetical protein
MSKVWLFACRVWPSCKSFGVGLGLHVVGGWLWTAGICLKLDCDSPDSGALCAGRQRQCSESDGAACVFGKFQIRRGSLGKGGVPVNAPSIPNSYHDTDSYRKRKGKWWSMWDRLWTGTQEVHGG